MRAVRSRCLWSGPDKFYLERNYLQFHVGMENKPQDRAVLFSTFIAIGTVAIYLGPELEGYSKLWALLSVDVASSLTG
jgi:hypothetical protein